MTVYAEHISYDLSGVPVSPFTADSAPDAMLKLQSMAAVDSPFIFWTDKSTVAAMDVPVPASTRSMLGGSDGSVLDVYGGEYKWDRYTVRLYNARGRNRGVSIRYGKNLTALEQEENISNVYTGVYPYWADVDGNLTQLPEKIINAPGTYDFIRILPLDLSQRFDAMPTTEQLQQAAEAYMGSNNIGVPPVSLSVSFAQLGQTEEYKDLALLETVLLTIYDVLLDRYNSVDLGDARTNIADTIAGQQQALEKAPTATDMQQAINNATGLITGNKGGYVVLHSSTGAKEPDEILIMDTPDISTAVKVWRWNKSGLGYSSTGYNGPYGLAMTADGAIVADFITAGTLTANLIRAGILSSKNGATTINLDTGNANLTGALSTIFTSLGGQQYRAKVSGTGITFYHGDTEIGSVDTRLLSGSPVLCAYLDWMESDVVRSPDIRLKKPDGSSYSALKAGTKGTILNNIEEMWIGGSGGVVGWKTVETVTGEFVLALCKV